MLVDTVQNPSDYLFRFFLEAMLWIREVEMVDSVGDFESSRSIQVYTHLPNFEMRLLLLWTRSSRIPNSRRRSVSRNRMLRKTIDFVVEDKSLTWSTTTFESLVLMIPFLIMRIYSQIIFAMMMFRNRYEMEWNSIVFNQNSTWWCLGKAAQIENTWVWSTQNLSGIVWHGNSSEDTDARLSQIENDVEEKHRSETQTAKLWRQKWENWNRGSGESQAWTPRTRWLEYREKPRPIRFVDRIHTIHHSGRRTSRWVFMVRRAVDEEANDIQARLLVARDMEWHGRSSETERIT